MSRCYASNSLVTKSVSMRMDTFRPHWAVVCDEAGCYGLRMLRPELICFAALVVTACSGPEVTCPAPMLIDRAMDRCVCPEGMEATEDGWSCMSLDGGVMDGGLSDAAFDGGADAGVQPDSGVDAGDVCETCIWGCAPDCDPPVAASAGNAHTCALRSSGATVCWGWNDLGQIATDPSDPVLRPRVIEGVEGVQLAAGRDHTCARSEGGEVWCWGGTFSGQLGTSVDEIRPEPRRVEGVAGAVDLAAGAVHGCVVTVDRTVTCWGGNEYGQLGVPPLEVARFMPAEIPDLNDVVQVVAGAGHSCARTNSGGVYCWGDNSLGQLGDTTLMRRTRPVEVRGITDAIDIFAGETHSCALTSGGELWCWGNNENGQLADGSQANRPTPVRTAGPRLFVDGVAGRTFTCGVAVGGELWCWGGNAEGQLGRGTRNDTANEPARVVIDGVASLTAGDAHVCATASLGLHCWGANDTGQIGNGGLGGVLTEPTLVGAP